MYNTELTQRLINRIESVEKFNDLAYICEDFETFVFEISEWGVDHIAGVDFDDPTLDPTMLDNFFQTEGCTKENPHPCSKYADAIQM